MSHITASIQSLISPKKLMFNTYATNSKSLFFSLEAKEFKQH